MHAATNIYERRIERTRNAIAEVPVIRRLLARGIEPDVLARFLIEYCSLGVQMTEPVEGWIARAGARCIELGLQEVGASLCDHARHEAGHHLMFISDTEQLVARWNARRASSLSAADLIARPRTAAIQSYIELHEQTIASELPFGQVAIELEIERLSVVLLPDLLRQFERVLGREVVDSLSFLGSHAALDVGHTHMNTRMMAKVLTLRPESAGELVRIGGEALLVYMRFLEECLELSEQACDIH